MVSRFHGQAGHGQAGNNVPQAAAIDVPRFQAQAAAIGGSAAAGGDGQAGHGQAGNNVPRFQAQAAAIDVPRFQAQAAAIDAADDSDSDWDSDQNHGYLVRLPKDDDLRVRWDNANSYKCPVCPGKKVTKWRTRDCIRQHVVGQGNSAALYEKYKRNWRCHRSLAINEGWGAELRKMGSDTEEEDEV